MLTITSRAGKDIMLLLAAVTLFAGCAPPGVRALLQGKKLLEEGKYPSAAEQLRLATVMLGNTNPQAFNYLGLACHQCGQNAEAERAYQRALMLSPDLAEARFNLGCLWLSENRLDQARAEFTAYTLRRGSSIDGWLKLGVAQLRLHEPSAAEKSFAEALRLEPQNPEALTEMGLARLQRSRSGREAVEWFSKALRAEPDYAPALLNLAIVAQENLKDRTLALHTYRAYLNLKPAPEHSHAVMAIVQQLEQELAPPAPAAIVSKPEPQPPPPASKAAVPEPRTNTKTAVVEVAHPAKAVGSEGVSKSLPPTNAPRPTPTQPASTQTFEVVKLPSEPVLKPAQDISSPAPTSRTPQTEKDAPTVTTKTASQTQEPKPPKHGFFQRLNPLNLFGGESKTTPRQGTPPQSPSASNEVPPNLALDSAATDPGAGAQNWPRYRYRVSGAIEAGDRATAEPWFAQGVKSQQAHRLQDALQAYRKAIEADPAYFDAQYNLGLAAYAANNLSLSLASYENALAIHPESEDARYNFALALKQANYPVDAAHELEKLLAATPTDGRAQLALGNLYAQQLHEPAKARAHYQKLLEIDPRNAQAPAVQYWLNANPK